MVATRGNTRSGLVLSMHHQEREGEGVLHLLKEGKRKDNRDYHFLLVRREDDQECVLGRDVLKSFDDCSYGQVRMDPLRFVRGALCARRDTEREYVCEDTCILVNKQTAHEVEVMRAALAVVFQANEKSDLEPDEAV